MSTELPTPIDQFRDFGKMSRLSRNMIVTEKIDGTNAQIAIAQTCTLSPDQRAYATEFVGDYVIFAGSRNRWITPHSDNYGFANWVQQHADELVTLGEGRHFGEWWGAGIQRKYNQPHKRLSLFNVSRFVLNGQTPGDKQIMLPPCVDLVPVLCQHTFDTQVVDQVLNQLRVNGSVAAPGFMNPEGVVVFHTAQGVLFKKTLEKDETPKTLQ